MKRLLWVGVGVVVTVVVLRQVSRLNDRVDQVAGALTPTGIASSIGSLAQSVTTLGGQLRESMAEHEESLRAALLPDGATLARARETRARRDRGSLPDLDDADVLPDDGTDYF